MKLKQAFLAVLSCAALYTAPTTVHADDNLNSFISNFSIRQTTAPATNNTITISNSTLNQPFSANASFGSSGKIDSLISTAKNFIGLPYRFGGTSPVSGFDCSGFMRYVFKQTADVDLPRTSGSMAQVGQQVSRDELKPGDMVFFSHGGGHISHVGMYVGEGRFIHSPSTGKSIEITALNSGYWSSRFVTARRVINL